jgi:hypothetical protein
MMWWQGEAHPGEGEFYMWAEYWEMWWFDDGRWYPDFVYLRDA